MDQPDNFSGLLGFVEKSAFNTQNYVQLEDYFKHSGHKDWADKAYIHLKDRELEKRSWYERWFVWFFWGLLAGYGRYPSRTLILSIGIILIGAIFRFNPEYLDIEYTKQWHMNYKMTIIDMAKIDGFFKKLREFEMLGKLWALRLITSFDQFIPAINLGVAKNWQPPELSFWGFWGWVHIYFQKISGWVLVPIWLAAIYSQFK